MPTLDEAQTFEEVLENPTKYGLPTFEEFKKNRERWLGRHDEIMGQVDKGSSALAKLINKYIYEFNGYRCKSLEEVERVANNEGLSLQQLKYTAEILPQGGGKCDILVKFVSKSEGIKPSK